MEGNSTLESGRKDMLNTHKVNFQIHLLFTEKPVTPSVEEIQDILQKRLGKIQPVLKEDEIYAFTLEDYEVAGSEGRIKAKVIITEVFPYQSSLISETYVNQERVDAYQYDIFVSDLLTSSLPEEKRIRIAEGMLLSMIEVFPGMDALWLVNQKKLLLNEEFSLLSDEEIKQKILLY